MNRGSGLGSSRIRQEVDLPDNSEGAETPATNLCESEEESQHALISGVKEGGGGAVEVQSHNAQWLCWGQAGHVAACVPFPGQSRPQ